MPTTQPRSPRRPAPSHHGRHNPPVHISGRFRRTRAWWPDTRRSPARRIASVLAPLGLRLSAAKTRTAHMSSGVDFLGFHIRWRRKRGTNKWHVYTFIADRPHPVGEGEDPCPDEQEIAAEPRGRAGQDQPDLARVDQLLSARGLQTHPQPPVPLRVVAGDPVVRALHRWRWKDVRRRFTTPDGRWKPIEADGITLFNPASVPVTRYRYRGNTIPNPWTGVTTA